MTESIIDLLKFRLSLAKLAKYDRITDIESIIDATKNYVGHGAYSRISMSQKRSEIRNLANAVKAINPKVIMEIGTRKGGTLFTWCRYTNAAKVISVDLPGGIHGGGYPELKQKLYRAFLSGQAGRAVHLIQEDSHAKETLEEVKRILNNEPVDFLFIDGDHTLEGVKMDFDMYSPLVRRGGLIAFHDIIPNTTDHEDAATIEVPVFWQQVKGMFRSEEFIESKDQGNMGIGLLRT